MTAELRNLPHIASMAFNEPLMLEPAYARVFFCALAGQLGISRLTDAKKKSIRRQPDCRRGTRGAGVIR
ncbi:minor capsid protein C from bacteriophage origin [Escherichia coli SHECO001]|nr:minor capsid protein C from bacteriophage origin [Escherichia coli SHECO001]